MEIDSPIAWVQRELHRLPGLVPLEVTLVRMRASLAMAVAFLFLTPQFAVATDNQGRKRDPYDYGIYHYYTRYKFDSNFPTTIGGNNCRARLGSGATQWNVVDRELRFAFNSTAWVNYIDVKWAHNTVPTNEAWAYVINNPWIGYISDSDMNFNASPDKPGGNPANTWDWYCGTGTPSSNAGDMYSIATHELGHTIEILHSGNSADTMWPYINAGTIDRRTLTTHDKDTFKAMYAPAS